MKVPPALLPSRTAAPKKHPPGHRPCQRCNRIRNPIVFTDAGCDICNAEQDRAEAENAELSRRPAADANGVITFVLSASEIESARDALLDACMWSQMADRRTKIGAEKAAEWDAYREALDTEARAARTESRNPRWPARPN